MPIQRINETCGCSESSTKGHKGSFEGKSALKKKEENINFDLKGISPRSPAILKTETRGRFKNANNEDDYTIEQLQKEAEMELEKALELLKATEHVLDTPKVAKDIVSKSLSTTDSSFYFQNILQKYFQIFSLKFQVTYENSECTECTSIEGLDTKSLIKSQFDCESALESSESDLIRSKLQKTNEKDIPPKPKLTFKQITQLIEAEKKDVDLALYLSLNTEEIYKKPCSKQQKAKQSIKQIADLKKNVKEESPRLNMQLRELIEPDSDDISPDTMAAIIFSQEKGILLDSSPYYTVRHLFPDHVKKKPASEEIKSDLDFMLSPDDGCSDGETVDEAESSAPPPGKNISLKEGSEFFVDASEDLQFQAESPCINKIQLRGSLPFWFPGYLAVFSDKGDKTIQSLKSPIEVFERAWMSVKPSNIPPDNIFVIE